MNENKNELEFKVPNFDLGMKKAVKSIAANSSLIVAVLAVVVAAMVFFTDLDGGFEISASFSTSLVVLFCCCVVEYYSTKLMGTKEGKREQRYIDVMVKHKDTSLECQAKVGMRGLMDFCTEYAEQDLIRRRTTLLKQIDMSYDTYAEKYIGLNKKELPAELPGHVRRCIARANRLKPMYISQDNLVFAVDNEKQAQLMLSTTKRECIKDLTFLIPTLVSTFFAASMVIEVIQDLSFATVTACMIKVFCIILNAVKGYQNGYYNIVDGHVECAEARIFLLQECISWSEKPMSEEKNE